MPTRSPVPHSKINLPAFLLLRMFVYLISTVGFALQWDVDSSEIDLMNCQPF